MKTNYILRKVTLKDSSKEHIERKLTKLERFFSDDADVTVKFILESNTVKSEITIKDKSTVYRAEDTQVDLTDAFDNSYDNIIRRIRKQKTKLEKRLRSTSFDEVFAPIDFEDGKDEKFEVIRSKEFYLQAISVDEAILQMNLIGHQFFIFENIDTNLISVVYKRNDGKYGLIETKN
ncbi:MAG: ribosome-associated translation inhibitor RaiA [Acutalibacteraceae bacterium]|nr:ribosome-associated translation inhibitor RaiA [Acutalibacteraceae bacterium]